MKKRFLAICTLLIILVGTLSAFAKTNQYSWYCVHCKEHLQPKMDRSFEFINNYDSFYIDKRHSDNCTEKVLYITFDAGYNNGNIDRILDVLKKENVPAAFFILGHLINDDPALVKRMFNEGHLVCNHTFSHKAMVGKSESEFQSEISKLEQRCLEITGKQIAKYYRPPEGKFDESSLEYAKSIGYKTVFWSFAYDDWDNNRQMDRDEAKKKILDNLHNGEIMLLHPTSATNADILEDVIREIKQLGYKFGTLDNIDI